MTIINFFGPRKLTALLFLNHSITKEIKFAEVSKKHEFSSTDLSVGLVYDLESMACNTRHFDSRFYAA
jgi:hypothetical protein